MDFPFCVSISRDQTWFFMHKRLPGPEGDFENRGRRPRFSATPEEPGKR